MKTRRAWYETGAVSPDSPSSPAHNAPDDRQYSKRRGLDPAALSLRPRCFRVLGVISFGGASTAPAIRGCRGRGLDPAALSLRPCCFGVLGVISFFGGASTAPAIRGCRACTGEASYFCTTCWGEKIFDNTSKINLDFANSRI